MRADLGRFWLTWAGWDVSGRVGTFLGGLGEEWTNAGPETREFFPDEAFSILIISYYYYYLLAANNRQNNSFFNLRFA